MAKACSLDFHEKVANKIINEAPEYIRGLYSVSLGSTGYGKYYADKIISNYLIYMMDGDSLAKYNYIESMNNFLVTMGMNIGNQYKYIAELEASMKNLDIKDEQYSGQTEALKKAYSIYSSWAYDYLQETQKTVKEISGKYNDVLEFGKGKSFSGGDKIMYGEVTAELTGEKYTKDGRTFYQTKSGTGVEEGTFERVGGTDTGYKEIDIASNKFKAKIDELTSNLDSTLSKEELKNKKANIINKYLEKLFGDNINPGLFKDIMLNGDLSAITDILIYKKIGSGTIGLEEAVSLLKKIKFSGQVDVNDNEDILGNIFLKSKQMNEKELRLAIVDFYKAKIGQGGFDSSLLGAVLYFNSTKPNTNGKILAIAKSQELGDIRNIDEIQDEIIAGKSNYSVFDQFELLGLNKVEVEQLFPDLRIVDSKGRVKRDFNSIYLEYIKNTKLGDTTNNLRITNLRASLKNKARISELKLLIQEDFMKINNYSEVVLSAFTKEKKTVYTSDAYNNIVVQNEYKYPTGENGKAMRVVSEMQFKEQSIKMPEDGSLLSIVKDQDFATQFLRRFTEKDGVLTGNASDRYFINAKDYNANFVYNETSKKTSIITGYDADKKPIIKEISNVNISVLDNNVVGNIIDGKVAFGMGNQVSLSKKLGIIGNANSYLLGRDLDPKALKQIINYSLGLKGEKANTFIKSLDPNTKYGRVSEILKSMSGREVIYTNGNSLMNDLIVESTNPDVLYDIGVGLYRKGYVVTKFPDSIPVNDLFNLKYGNEANAIDNIAGLYGVKIDTGKVLEGDLGKGILTEYADDLPRMNTDKLDYRALFIEYLVKGFDSEFKNIPAFAEYEDAQRFINGTVAGAFNGDETRAIITYINSLADTTKFNPVFNPSDFRAVLEDWFAKTKNISGEGVTRKIPEMDYIDFVPTNTTSKYIKNTYWSDIINPEQNPNMGKELFGGMVDNPSKTLTSLTSTNIANQADEVIKEVDKLQKEYKSKILGTNKSNIEKVDKEIISDSSKIEELVNKMDNNEAKISELGKLKSTQKNINTIDNLKKSNANDLEKINKLSDNINKNTILKNKSNKLLTEDDLFALHYEYNNKIKNTWNKYADRYKSAFPYIRGKDGTRDLITEFYKGLELNKITDVSNQQGLIDGINTDIYITKKTMILNAFESYKINQTLPDRLSSLLEKGYTNIFHKDGVAAISIEDGILSMLEKIDPRNMPSGYNQLDAKMLNNIDLPNKRIILSKLYKQHIDEMIDATNNGVPDMIGKYFNNNDLSILANNYQIVTKNISRKVKGEIVQYRILVPQIIANKVADNDTLFIAHKVMQDISASIINQGVGFDVSNAVDIAIKQAKGTEDQAILLKQAFANYQSLFLNKEILQALTNEGGILDDIYDVFKEYKLAIEGTDNNGNKLATTLGKYGADPFTKDFNIPDESGDIFNNNSPIFTKATGPQKIKKDISDDIISECAF